MQTTIYCGVVVKGNASDAGRIHKDEVTCVLLCEIINSRSRSYVAYGINARHTFLRVTSSLVTPRYDHLNTDYDLHDVRLADGDWYVFDIYYCFI